MSEAKPVSTAVATQQKPAVPAISPSRLPYHPALRDMGVDQVIWRVLCETIFPNAKSIEGIALAVRYCKARNLDIMKKMVHVVPMWSTSLKRSVETVWPGIAEYRTTAARTGEYAGCSETEMGPLIEETFTGIVDEYVDRVKTEVEKSATIKYHEWMRITVYRIVKGVRCPFIGPKVYFKETYSRVKFNVDLPNDRWQKAPMNMLEKCAEAAALRKAFPEEMPADATAEEMEGKVIDMPATAGLPPLTDKQVEAIADDHMKQVEAIVEDKKPAEEAKQPAETTPSEPSPDDEWFSKYENEIQPGILSCKTNQDLMDFLQENSDLIKEIPVSVRDHLDADVSKKLTSFKVK